MRTHRRSLTRHALGFVALALAAGCSDDGNSPQQPETPRYDLTGHIRLISKLTDSLNGPLGTETVEDAGGVLVRLLGAGGPIDSVRTTAGDYTFEEVLPGSYRTEVKTAPGSTVAGAQHSVVDQNVVLTDTLIVGPSVGIATYPNPGIEEGIAVEFTMQAAQTYLVEVRSFEGDLVWSYSSEAPPGFYHVHWSGEELHKHGAPAGYYWILARIDGQVLRSLVYWPGEPEVPSEGNCGHIVAEGFQLELAGVIVVSGWGPQSNGLLRSPIGGWTDPIRMRFIDADSVTFAVADTCPDNHLTWSVADTSVADIELAGDAKWAFRIYGKQVGETELILSGWHEDHIHFTTPQIRVVVDFTGRTDHRTRDR